ncbi:MAG: hypothetical protein ABI606_03930 [Rhodoferax sp.]
MSKAPPLIDTEAFVERLRLAHNGIGIRPSASGNANEFNLRYCTLAPTFKAQDSGTDMTVLNMQDRAMLARYMTLSLADRKTVCDVVVALATAATVKARS